MQAARMQSTNVEFMGTKCLQMIWKRPSTACRRCGFKVGGYEDERRGDGDIYQSISQSGGELHWSDGCVRCGT